LQAFLVAHSLHNILLLLVAVAADMVVLVQLAVAVQVGLDARKIIRVEAAHSKHHF
jgi:hypothetical protein